MARDDDTPTYGEKGPDRPHHDDLVADAHEPDPAVAPGDNGETHLGPGSGVGSNTNGANLAEEAAAPADPSRGA